MYLFVWTCLVTFSFGFQVLTLSSSSPRGVVTARPWRPPGNSWPPPSSTLMMSRLERWVIQLKYRFTDYWPVLRFLSIAHNCPSPQVMHFHVKSHLIISCTVKQPQPLLKQICRVSVCICDHGLITRVPSCVPRSTAHSTTRCVQTTVYEDIPHCSSSTMDRR